MMQDSSGGSKPTLAEGWQPRLRVFSCIYHSTNITNTSTRNTGPTHTKIEPFPGMEGEGGTPYPPTHVPGQPGVTPLIFCTRGTGFVIP